MPMWDEEAKEFNRDAVLGIIVDPGYGCRDVGRPILWFTVYTSESSASLQCFSGADADKIITDAQVHDVHDLHGKPCWVSNRGALVQFHRVAKIHRITG